MKTKVVEDIICHNFHDLSLSWFWVERVQNQKGVIETLEIRIQITPKLLEISQDLHVLFVFQVKAKNFHVES